MDGKHIFEGIQGFLELLPAFHGLGRERSGRGVALVLRGPYALCMVIRALDPALVLVVYGLIGPFDAFLAFGTGDASGGGPVTDILVACAPCLDVLVSTLLVLLGIGVSFALIAFSCIVLCRQLDVAIIIDSNSLGLHHTVE